mmetsp:Transcript_61443/g.194494  ORF Transcript_61443/g.194494 Transcript_61443/m.194494 type:complete len:267 (+) Transcript_61443:1160-1960(+)
MLPDDAAGHHQHDPGDRADHAHNPRGGVLHAVGARQGLQPDVDTRGPQGRGGPAQGGGARGHRGDQSEDGEARGPIAGRVLQGGVRQAPGVQGHGGEPHGGAGIRLERERHRRAAADQQSQGLSRGGGLHARRRGYLRARGGSGGHGSGQRARVRAAHRAPELGVCGHGPVPLGCHCEAHSAAKGGAQLGACAGAGRAVGERAALYSRPAHRPAALLPPQPRHHREYRYPARAVQSNGLLSAERSLRPRGGFDEHNLGWYALYAGV